MATYEKRIAKKDGHITYGIQIKVKDYLGKDKFVNTTWKNPNNLTGERAKKAAIAFGETWEAEYKNGHTHKLSNASFNQVANEWLRNIKHRVSLNYILRSEDCIKRMTEYFGDVKFVDLRAHEIQQFITYLNEYTYKTITAKVKEHKLEEFKECLKLNGGARKAERDGIISRPVFYYATHGEPIAYSSAEKICSLLKIGIKEFFEKIIIEKGYAKETILKYQHTLSAIFNYAIKNELVTSNYASSVYTKDSIGGRKTEEAKILTNQEYDKFIDTLKLADNKLNEKGEPLNLIWETMPLYIMSQLGLRTAEVCGLKWEDVDLENRVLSVCRNRVYTPKYGVYDKDTKTTKSTRKLFISDLLAEKLQQFKDKYEELKKADKKFDKRGYIFCNIDGTPKFPQYLNYLLQKYLLEANVTVVSNHKIRHTWITRLITNGAPVNGVAQMAGHADKNTTLKIYTHFSKDVKASQELLTKYL